MKTSENTKNLNLAMFKFQGIMPKIKRNATNSHFRSTYITWDDLADAVIPRLQECGLYFEQEEGEVDGYVTVSTRITHAESGEWKQYAPYRIKEASTGNQDHNAGKSTTYAQKRSLILALGLRGTDEDTDGNDIDPPKKISAYKREASSRYEEKKMVSNNALGPWNELAENKRSEMRTGMPCRHELDLPTERKKFFSKATKRGLSDPRMRALAFFHFGKESRSKLTAKEFNRLSEILEREDDISILKMIHKAKAMRETG